MRQFQKFKELHEGSEPLILGNVWNVQSARLVESMNYKALGTSSAAIASSLGYSDGQQMSIQELFLIVGRILDNSHLPLSVDLEHGYGENVKQIADIIEELHNMGVAGINLEDSYLQDGIRVQQEVNAYNQFLEKLVSELQHRRVEIFVNIRIDSFLINQDNAITEIEKRIKSFQKDGIHGIFIPGIVKQADIEQVVAWSALPVNVMCFPGLPTFAELSACGVKRISMGNFLYEKVYKAGADFLHTIQQEQSFISMIS